MKTQEITFASLLVCILFAVKLKFLINIDGFELVTFTIATYGLYIKFKTNLIIVICFIFLTGIFYGFGIWWFAYWYIWPTELLLTLSLRKIIIKNNIIFGSWCGILGFSIWIFYFPLHLLTMGYAAAVGFVIPGIIVNSVEGAFNMLIGICLFYPLQRTFKALPDICKSKLAIQLLKQKNKI